MINSFTKKIGLSSSLTMGFLGVFIYLIFLWFVSNVVGDIETAYHDIKMQVSTAEKVAVIKTVEKNYDQQLTILDEFFIKNGNEAMFIGELESLAKENGVNLEITSIAPDTKREKGFKEDLRVRINIEGGWSSVVLFIDKLGKLKFSVLEEEVFLDRANDNLWSGGVYLTVFREK